MFTFELSEQMTMVIASALSNHPYKEAAPVILELQKQINNQTMPIPSKNGKVDEVAENKR